jgi:hypothetical protein
MIGTPAPLRALRVPLSVGRLRATEVYAQALADRLTLLAHADAGRADDLGDQLAEIESACSVIEATVRPMLESIDPTVARNVDAAASVAQQRGEATCPSLMQHANRLAT